MRHAAAIAWVETLYQPGTHLAPQTPHQASDVGRSEAQVIELTPGMDRTNKSRPGPTYLQTGMQQNG